MIMPTVMTMDTTTIRMTRCLKGRTAMRINTNPWLTRILMSRMRIMSIGIEEGYFACCLKRLKASSTTVPPLSAAEIQYLEDV
jgi:hypothetical protein